MTQVLLVMSSCLRNPSFQIVGRSCILRKTCQFRKLSLHSTAGSLVLSSHDFKCMNYSAQNFSTRVSRHVCQPAERNLIVGGQTPLFNLARRHFTVDTYNKYFSPDVAPIGYAQKVLESIHSVTGLPWWASIALSTLMLRGVVTLPLAVYSMHIMARVELLQPEINKLSQELRQEVAVAVKKFAWDAKYARFKYNSTMKKLIKELYIRENCHPVKSSLVLWFQIPMWVCLSFALRNMSGAVPTSPNTEAAVLCPDLKTEGTLWFPDLTQPDSTWLLPLLLGATNLLNIEMNTLTSQRASKFQKGLVFVMRAVSVIMVPVGAVVPSCMCYYWMCSSLFGLVQTIFFKTPSVRRALRIPRTPSESQTPFMDIYNAARHKYVHRLKREKDSS